MTNLQKLNAICMKYKAEKYPNIPAHAVVKPSYSDKTANQLTKAIIDYCKFSGYFAERTGSEGRTIDNRKTYTDAIGRVKTFGDIKRIPSSGTKGTSDIKAVINGMAIAIEVKIGKDRQSDVQKEYQKQIERAGGQYWIVRSFDGFISKINEIIA